MLCLKPDVRQARHRTLGWRLNQEMLTRLRCSIDQLVQYPELLEKMSEKAQNVTDGLGAYRVADQLLETYENRH